ncbi:hypothetical protein C440_09557 [Haloferax mucosum ATCC BAA-1512]|uniref:DUF7344 domain-containing protein n=1 Tax=Haloferax mucosum ATCC BAA-1512 TaxID=662479 RepID=M0IIN6_9EURY|nr:hypothetical protein [Haloferax mucosum]ELZ95314.1 hypothetical protein C440_09557 [Haloferax mucosum ATCC BAA-1512]
MSESKPIDGSVGRTGSTVAGESAAEPTRDDVFEALSNRRRRYALHYLKQLDADGPVELSAVSAQVAAWERGTDPQQLSYDDRKNVHTALYQFHAPKMDELGLINYDTCRGTVELTDAGRELDVYLQTATGTDAPWSVYFLFLSLGTTTLVGAVWLGFYPFSLVSGVAWAELVAVSFLVSSAVFAYHDRYSVSVNTAGPPPEIDD